MYQRLWYDDEDVDDEDVDDDEELTYVDGVPELPVEEGEAWGNWHSVPENENMRRDGSGQWRDLSNCWSIREGGRTPSRSTSSRRSSNKSTDSVL